MNKHLASYLDKDFQYYYNHIFPKFATTSYSTYSTISIDYDDEIVILEGKLEGYKKADINIIIEGRNIKIEAKKKTDKNWHCSFLAIELLPSEVDADKAKVTFVDEVLKIILPRIEEKITKHQLKIS